MTMPDREGTWAAYPRERVVKETGPNDLLTAIIRYDIVAEAQDGEWVDVQDEGLEITGYHYIEKRDGSLNDITLDQLADAFSEWSRKDVYELEEDEKFAACCVQITTKAESWNGQERIKVGWLSRYDDKPTFGGGDFAPDDDKKKRSVRNRLNSKLSAHFGGSSRPTPKPKADKPSPPKKPAPPSKPSKPSKPEKKESEPEEPQTSSFDAAWQAVVDTYPSTWAQEKLEETFWSFVKEVSGGDDPEALTPEQWGEVHRNALTEIPF